MHFERLEHELRKRLEIPYRWGVRQNNEFDRLTNFIYTVDSFEALKIIIKKDLQTHKEYKLLCHYALNRWFNFWSAKAVEAIFKAHEIVEAAPNSRDREVDFYIQNIPFDHKTSVYPKAYKYAYKDAQKNNGALIQWLYKNQSQQQRKHLKNRLFIILVNTRDSNEHWKLKAEISWLRGIIETYLENFDSNKLHRIKFGGHWAQSDIIWAVK